ncbi:MAG: response regulator [Chloroflexaceae bacterium]|nr:response regulator [Chloroflexaceae bacterium]
MTTVLIVEDYAPNYRLLSFVLEQNGYAVVCARDGMQALDYLQMMPIDVIVTDLIMPRLDGIELTARVRADARFDHVPIIVVTASGKECDAVRAAGVGVDVFLTKPVESEDLVRAVAQVVAREQDRTSPLHRWRHSRVA